MDCVYTVHIPCGMAMNIHFYDFNLEPGFNCGYDYLKISNENNQTVGIYCGYRSGHTVLVTGDYVVMSFHSDTSVQRRGYKLLFSAVPLGSSILPSSSILRPTGSYLSASSTILRPTATYLPTGASSVVSVTRYPTAGPRPTGCPPATPTPDPQSRLKNYITSLRSLFDQMEDIVDNELGGDYNVSKREHIARKKKSVNDEDEAMKSTGRQKREAIKTTMVDQQKKKAADLMKRLENKQAQDKRLKTPLKRQEKKREAGASADDEDS